MSLYFVAIEPDCELSYKIREIQKDFAERFASKKAYNNFPHITIIPPFMHDEKNESEVVGHFQKAVLALAPFKIEVKGFGSFPNKHKPVIYIKPKSSDGLADVYRAIDLNMKIFNYVRNFNPHFTVAYRDLTYDNFEKAWSEYETKSFDAVFEVSTIGLYKHFDQKWNLMATKQLKKS